MLRFAWLIEQPNETHPTQCVYRQAGLRILYAINHRQSFCQRAENPQFWPAAHACVTVWYPSTPLPFLPPQRCLIGFNPSAGALVLPRQETDNSSLVHPLSQALIGLLCQTDWDDTPPFNIMPSQHCRSKNLGLLVSVYVSTDVCDYCGFQSVMTLFS